MRLTLALLVALAVASPASAAQPKALEASGGDVQARVTWLETEVQGVMDVRLTIRRGATIVVDQDVLDEGRPTAETPWALFVRDLDGNGELEVVLDLDSGGAHCCLSSLVEQYDAVAATYVGIRHAWGNSSPRLRDLARDGIVEFVATDDRFAYVFACYACGALPIQIWRYEPGRFVDVTRDFPALVRKDAAGLWKGYRETVKSEFPEVRGILAAWMADQALLGKASSAWRTLQRLERRGVLEGDEPWPSGKRYLRELRRFLTRTSYL
jgi:hypothetical protein